MGDGGSGGRKGLSSGNGATVEGGNLKIEEGVVEKSRASFEWRWVDTWKRDCRFFSPEGDSIKSNADSSASSVECGRAVEKMRGLAKLMRNDRTVGEQSKTARFTSQPFEFNFVLVNAPPEQPTALPKVISLTPILPFPL
jgi:hypothetical protein